MRAGLISACLVALVDPPGETHAFCLRRRQISYCTIAVKLRAEVRLHGKLIDFRKLNHYFTAIDFRKTAV